MHPTPVDAAGHKRAAVTLPGYHSGRPPRNKGRRYPADPPTVEEIIAVMRAAGTGPDGARLRALIVVLWRAGLRIGEALALTESDMDPRRRAVLVRRGKGNKRREVGMDTWAWEQLQPWQQVRTARVHAPAHPEASRAHTATKGAYVVARFCTPSRPPCSRRNRRLSVRSRLGDTASQQRQRGWRSPLRKQQRADIRSAREQQRRVLICCGV